MKVRTAKIGAVREALARSGELIGRAVAVIPSCEHNAQCLFTDLETIKPEMSAEATRDARHAAEQFARDSVSRVGGIQNAQQGLFSIDDRDPFSPEVKRVRAVTRVQFSLEDGCSASSSELAGPPSAVTSLGPVLDHGCGRDGWMNSGRGWFPHPA